MHIENIWITYIIPSSYLVRRKGGGVLKYKCLKCGEEFDAMLEAVCPKCGAHDWDVETLRKYKLTHPE